ncbi:hypothetical protein [Bosea sp. TAF32]|uniref:hypothetical protein n=1 Tax=Bosea sp. TAF32 TaxID=3237482 RepID=UPI003F8FFA7C
MAIIAINLPVLQSPDLLFELLGNRAMAGEDVDRSDFSGFIVRDHMHNRDALGGAAQALALIQRVVFRFRRDALGRNQLLPMGL